MLMISALNILEQFIANGHQDWSLDYILGKEVLAPDFVAHDLPLSP